MRAQIPYQSRSIMIVGLLKLKAFIKKIAPVTPLTFKGRNVRIEC